MQAGDPDGARPGEPAHRGELPSEPVQMKTTSAAAERVHHALVEPDLSNDNAADEIYAGDTQYDEPTSEVPMEDEYGYDDEYDMQDDDIPEDALYDDDEYGDELDEEELSSSPSIPDENINFDLVYALHTFVATVDGQATVQKGDHLVLLDDSNSYWWLVRVMASQEVGYIPAENIETPYERLARLNKHRNVEITTATDHDHENVPSDTLIKSRTNGDINVHSGKVSALSRRTPGTTAARDAAKQRGVLFGQLEYVEHSGNEASEDEYDEYDDDEYEADVTEEDAAEADAALGTSVLGLQANEPDASHLTPRLAAATLAPAPEDAAALAAPAPVAATSAPTPRALSPGGLFAGDDSREERRRPGSLVGMPGSVPMFNVVRVFAGENVECSATFKTVLLNTIMTARDLVRQAMQRFEVRDDADDYGLLLRRLDGSEHVFEAHERPLALLESLADEARDGDGDLLGTKHDSVGSLSSLLDSNTGRVTYDYCDDRFGKFYFVRKGPYFGHEDAADMSASQDGTLAPQLRFTIKLALFADDLPDGVVFDPHTGATTRGTLAPGVAPGTSQARLLRFVRNATVAEVIEAGLNAFQLPEGVVDGGDDVESRSALGMQRVKYALSAVTDQGEQRLLPASKVLAAYDTLPILRPDSPHERRRRSLDKTVQFGMAEDVHATDPLFVLRIAQPPRTEPSPQPQGTPRSWGGAERWGEAALSPDPAPRLAHGTPSDAFLSPDLRPSAPLDTRSSVSPSTPRSGTETVLERSPPVESLPAPVPSVELPTVQPNDVCGVDLIVQEGVRVRSSRVVDSPRVRYSLLSTRGPEQDAGNALRSMLHEMSPRLASAELNQSDLLERFVEQLASMPDASVSANIEMMLSRIGPATTPAPAPAATAAASEPPLAQPRPSAPTFEATRGLHIPNKMSSLSRTSSVRSVSAGDSALETRAVRAPPCVPQRVGDRVLSDTTVTTGTDRQGRERPNISALYSIVDAMVLESSTLAPAPASRHHQRVTSTSSVSSQQTGVHRMSLLMAALLDDSPDEKLRQQSQGLFALPWPTHPPPSAAVGLSRQQYAPLMSRINSSEQVRIDLALLTQTLDAMLQRALRTL